MEIKAAVAPTLCTRMQNNLGRIKPVVFAARQSSERKKERKFNWFGGVLRWEFNLVTLASADALLNPQTKQGHVLIHVLSSRK